MYVGVKWLRACVFLIEFKKVYECAIDKSGFVSFSVIISKVSNEAGKVFWICSDFQMKLTKRNKETVRKSKDTVIVSKGGKKKRNDWASGIALYSMVKEV